MSLVGVVLILAAQAVSETFTYRSPAGAEFVVTPEGLSSIRIGGRELAKGGWTGWNAEGWFKDSGSGKVRAQKIQEKTFEKAGPDLVRVRHAKEDAAFLFEYSFSGEDVTISARVENRHASEPMNVAGFSGLEFLFDRVPEGLMYVQHVSYFQAHGVGLCHPGPWARIGGSWAADGTAGVGLSPWRTGLSRTLILWDYADWNPDKREKLPRRRPICFAVGAVPPRGARTFDFRLRVSPRRDWRHLMEPYREHFRATFGEVRYRPDFRWIATDYLNHSQKAVSKENPYGFHGGFRRIDTPEGAKAFCDTVIPVLKENGGQGAIVWGQGGDDPRGAMYRPDFDVLPPEVEAQWGTILGRFKEAGLRFGVCTRPRDVAVRLDWKSDQTIDINPDDPGHRAMIWRRFENMIKKGCTHFYLDSFGSSLEDVKLMAFLREKMGPDILTYCEHQCDAIVPFSGGYSETTLDAEKPGREPSYVIWSGLETWEVYRWLAPGGQLASRLYQVKGRPPESLESPERFFYRNKVTPLVPVSDFRRAPSLRTLQPEFLDPSGRWK